ncbi:MAG: biotin/lipoyl-binding protein [Pseudomonadota bacterium]
MNDGDSALAPLREELRILEAAPYSDGAPCWTIFDPLRHRFFAIGGEELSMLSAWSVGTTTDICHALGRPNDPALAERLIRFANELSANGLTVSAPGSAVARAEEAERAKAAWWRWLVHNYLFVRIPLVRPGRILESVVPHLGFLFSQTWWLVLFGVFAASLYLLVLQWPVFLTTAADAFSLEGLVFFALALAGVKVCHELGHGIAATWHGCRVGTMGVAFIVLFPVLYTDTSDAWRLPSRKHRLLIDAAGVLAELNIAILATAVWVLAPDGPLRSAMFFLATASWITSLAVNLNPFMRFDGYYFLSDLTGERNLQTRSFSWGRWQLREWLFDLRESKPEGISPMRARYLVAYAWATWVYRFVLFISIALLVYHLFFKLLGVILLLTELAWFIGRPIASELVEWWKRRKEIAMRSRPYISLLCLVVFTALVVIPWDARVAVPVVISSEKGGAIHLSESARLRSVHVHEGAAVKTGDILFRFDSPALEFELSQVQNRIRLQKQTLSTIASDPGQRAQRLITEHELNLDEERADAIRRRLDALVIVAPHDGEVRDLDPYLHRDRWVGPEHSLGRIIHQHDVLLRGFLSADDLVRVRRGITTGWFIPDDIGLGKQAVRLRDVAPTAATDHAIPYLASVFDGPIPTERDAQGDLKLLRAFHEVTLESMSNTRWPRATRGAVVLEGDPESYFARVHQRVLAVLSRESGF